ncbi:MAG: amino acid ABC transporter permease [Atopobiaceae bacterium]|nr:amino acid ABC transporter permease [Atopobiaceae bacterium]
MPASVLKAASGRRALRALVFGVVLLLSLVLSAPAFALTTNKATARPNEDGGHSVIGGLPTRLTWEGTVGADEEVTSVTLELPEGGSFDNSTTKITVLEGLTRIAIDGVATADGERLTVEFSEPIPAESLLRLEVEGTVLPAEGGDVSVGGSYTTSDGTTSDLEASKPISTISNTWLQSAVAWLDDNPAVQAWNSFSFTGMFLKPQLILTSLVSLFPGWLLCLAIVVIAYPFAIAIGMLFALMKISKNKLLRAIAIVYINILRGTPLFLQIYIMFFGLPMLDIHINNNVLGVIVIAINSSAYLAEIFRAGIESIPVGQYEAASSLGMSHIQTMLTIIIPQTVRRVIPTVTSDFITSYKDTSLLSSVGVMELMMFAKNATSISGNMTPYVTAAIFYLIITLPLIKVVGIIEANIARSERGGGRPGGNRAKAAEKLAAEEAMSVAGSSHFEGLDRAESPIGALLAPFVPKAPALSAMGGDGNVR